jgi:hypothetical protein
MPSPTEISIEQLTRIIGLLGAPTLIDVRPSDVTEATLTGACCPPRAE